MVKNAMLLNQALRQIGVIVLLPAYLVAGGFISDLLSRAIGVWEYYLYAIFIPVIGLVCTWVISPFEKVINLLAVYSAGILLAYFLACPAFYPEGHPQAYTETYTPF